MTTILKPAVVGILSIILLVLMFDARSAASSEPQAAVIGNLPDVSQSTEPERKALIEQFSSLQKHQAALLISLLSDSSQGLRESRVIRNGSIEWFSVTMLGKMKSDDAIPILISLLRLRDSEFELSTNESIPHWRAFPCAIALSEIGSPAVEPLLDVVVQSEPESTAFALACITLHQILGNELAQAAVRIRFDNPSLSLNQEKLSDALKLIDSSLNWRLYKPKDYNPKDVDAPDVPDAAD